MPSSVILYEEFVKKYSKIQKKYFACQPGPERASLEKWMI
jgi:hypothetical protein